MWSVSINDLKMAEGDFGIALPIAVTGITLGATDTVLITFKTEKNGDVIIEKEYTDVQDNTVNLEFTEAESALFPVGNYVYRMDVYRERVYLNNLIPLASFKVVDVA